MKVSRLQAERNREAVLGTASRMFRERGVEATSVVDIFKEVGLTHGALYVQFPGGKETLAAEAVEKAFADRQAVWEDLAANHRPTEALRAIIANYLSIEHRENPGTGCPLPSMGAEAGRRGGAIQTAYTSGVSDLLKLLSDVTSGESGSERRKAALNVLSTLAGAMLISRAVNDPALADEIMEAIAEP